MVLLLVGGGNDAYRLAAHQHVLSRRRMPAGVGSWEYRWDEYDAVVFLPQEASPESLAAGMDFILRQQGEEEEERMSA